MQQHVVADAAGLGGDIESTGHVAVYGITFDSTKSVVKPESKPSLDEIAKLLKQDPTLKLKVVGHTDMVGLQAANMTLSQARAGPSCRFSSPSTALRPPVSGLRRRPARTRREQRHRRGPREEPAGRAR
jgi:hypothetical protein